MDFLNNLNLNKNELQNAVVQKLDVAPGTPVDGQVYFSTASDTLFVRAGGAWVDALKQGDVTGVTSATPSTLSVTDGTGPVPSIGIITAAIEAGGEGLATAGQIVDYVASISSGVVSVSSGDTDRITIGGTASAPTVDANTAAIADGGVNLATGDQIHTFITDFGYTTNTGTVTSVSAGDGIALSGTGTVDPTISVKLSSATNYIEIAPAIDTVDTADKIAYSNSDEDVKKVTFGEIPMAALDLVKTYVDTAVAGASSFQGGYDANTNTPDLTLSPAAGTILQGFQWAVTADGTFFTEQVRVGDLLIADVDNPTTLAEWTTVQSNVDLASSTTVGLASFSDTNFAVSAAGAVTIKDGGVILGTETTGNYVAALGTSTGLDNTTGTGAGSTPTISLDFSELPEEPGIQFIMYLDGEAVPTRTSAADASGLLNVESTYAVTITADAVVTHNLNTEDVIVQLYDTVTAETVFANVERSGVNTVTVSFGNAPANDIRVLVQKIG